MARLAEFLSLLSLQLAAGLVGLGVLRFALPAWWRRRGVRRMALGVLTIDLLLPLAWFVLARDGTAQIADGLVPLLILLFAGQGALAIGLALVALLKAASRRPLGANAPAHPGRRRFLLGAAAAAVPVAAASVCGAGVAEAGQVARLRLRTVRLPRLPAALEGMRILHISDVHLWTLVHVDDLARALDQVTPGDADLVCVTGDLADDFTQLPDALERIAALAPPLGCFASLGNHEHARGLEKCLPIFAAGPVSLLRTAGRHLRWRDTDLSLLGIDDPRANVHQSRADFYKQQVASVMAPVPADTFTILMSHRPPGFDEAARHGIDLTLSGHTHGGQAALFGHSILEVTSPEKYPWGVYRLGESVLHVTCGAGQWFPFRLGCPAELVMLELRRGEPA